MAMGLRYFVHRSLINKLPYKCLVSTARNMSKQTDKCKNNAEKKPKCSEPFKFVPEYFKTPKKCKTDEELTDERSLGVYLRCKPPYNPIVECMPSCFGVSRFDRALYRPSKSLDRKYQQCWVECVQEKLPKRSCPIVKPPIVKRKPKKSCAKKPRPICKTIRPMKCTPLKEVTMGKEIHCIKFPLCECKAVGANTRCRIRPKTAPTCKRPMTRYPSFSECRKDSLPKPPITECVCLKTVPLCELWRMFRARNRH
ncbi:uncharacterized protein LOC108595677 [Drosophila busckii]|uniref:uncharacterized protein LOC108595677 n=1 Tax=Drosophila busckii TaxID=30019 RepID=UPI00083EA462|nr:uncharacterized protein LOC108595677 [Drosophila busckii]